MPHLITRSVITLLAMAGLSIASHASSGHGDHKEAAGSEQPSYAAWANEVKELSPPCGLLASSAFDNKGNLWVIWTTEKQIYISQSVDKGTTYKPAILIHDSEFGVSNSAEGRPLVEVAPNGDVYVVYRLVDQKPRTGHVYFARSIDNGQTFSTPLLISDEAKPTFKAFHTMTVDSDGIITLAWLDKRISIGVKAAGGEYNGSTTFFAQSSNRGESFGENKKVGDYTCQCCRTFLKNDGNQGVVFVWRNIFGANTRDHAIATIVNGEVEGGVKRVSVDNWQVDGCPHHGPALDIDDNGRYHVTWFSGGGDRLGLFYSYTDDKGSNFSQPMAFGDENLSSHPFISSSKNNTVLVWKEFDGERTAIKMIVSSDHGVSWTDPVSIASSGSESGHPMLIRDDKWVYLAWRSTSEGYRLFKIAAQ